MDHIERFFKKNRAQFDELELEPGSWEQLRQQLSASPSRQAKTYILWRNIAAVFVIGLLLANLFPRQTPPKLATNFGLKEQMHFPNLELRNPDGELVALSSLKGKVVLVEFWASYCMMCTEEHCYYFKPLYNTYKDQGFEIYSVSVDSSATNWLQVIERDQLDWVQVSDLMGPQSPVNEKFEVNALPTNYLLDQEGKIIAKNIPVEDLEAKLSSLLAYQQSNESSTN
ncbi:MAG: redoxin family protein [Bacteroidota bacterium]